MKTLTFVLMTLLFLALVVLAGVAFTAGGFWLHFLIGMALGAIYSRVVLIPFLFNRSEW